MAYAVIEHRSTSSYQHWRAPGKELRNPEKALPFEQETLAQVLENRFNELSRKASNRNPVFFNSTVIDEVPGDQLLQEMGHPMAVRETRLNPQGTNPVTEVIQLYAVDQQDKKTVVSISSFTHKDGSVLYQAQHGERFASIIPGDSDSTYPDQQLIINRAFQVLNLSQNSLSQ